MTHNNFPQPSADAIEHSQALLALMSDDIKKQGGLSFYDFMHRALYQPGYGYYSSGSIKFGEKGDFMTAPLISPLFAQCISRQCNQVIEKMSVPCIFELGAGTGHLAAGILTALAENFSLPDYYYILEVSADCRAQQQATIKSLAPEYYDLVVWLDKLPLEPINGVILANEVLDAMPIHRFRVGEQLEEMRVILSEDRLAWSMSTEVSDQLSMAIDRLGVDFYSPYVSEINLALPAWVASLSECLAQGVMFFIDYGFPRSEYYHSERHQGTLMCHYRHRAHSDPFFFPGLQDITAHVDFTAVAEAADKAGLEVAGFTHQAAFLTSCGILDKVPKGSTLEEYNINQQVNQLLHPGEMGELFKVMALSKGYDKSLLGFELLNQLYRL